MQTRTGRLPRPTHTSRKTGLRSWELNSGLTIRERRNASGSVSFRLDVPARVSGKRQLLQFRDYHTARAEADRTVESKEQFGRDGFQLSRAQIDDAAGALTLLAPFSVSLCAVAEYYASHEQP